MSESRFVSLILAVLLAFTLACNKGGSSSSANGGDDDDGQSEPSFTQCLEWMASSAGADLPPIGCPSWPDIRDDILADGGGIFPIGDNMYFIVWFPNGWEDVEHRTIIFSIHGTIGCAEAVFSDWYLMTQGRSYALVALQHYDPSAPPDEQYDEDYEIYDNLGTIIDLLHENCPVSGSRVFLHGFSKGSAMTFPIAVRDRASDGRKAFSAFISDSGAWPPNGQMYPTLREVVEQDDRDAFGGARFWMYCGEQDYDHGYCMCVEMENAEQFVTDYGGTVDRLYEDPNGTHGIFTDQQPDDPSDAILALFDYIDSF